MHCFAGKELNDSNMFVCKRYKRNFDQNLDQLQKMALVLFHFPLTNIARTGTVPPDDTWYTLKNTVRPQRKF